MGSLRDPQPPDHTCNRPAPTSSASGRQARALRWRSPGRPSLPPALHGAFPDGVGDRGVPLPNCSVAARVTLAKASTLGSWPLRAACDLCILPLVAPGVFSQMLSGPRGLPRAELQDKEKGSCLQGHGFLPTCGWCL